MTMVRGPTSCISNNISSPYFNFHGKKISMGCKYETKIRVILNYK
jgi:hypothetical protein